MKNILTAKLQVLTIRNERVVYSESFWSYLKSFFGKGLTLNITDSSQYRGVKAKGIQVPIKKDLYI